MKLPEKKRTAAAALADVKLPGSKRRTVPYAGNLLTAPAGKGKRRKGKDEQPDTASKPVLVLGETRQPKAKRDTVRKASKNHGSTSAGRLASASRKR